MSNTPSLVSTDDLCAAVRAKVTRPPYYRHVVRAGDFFFTTRGRARVVVTECRDAPGEDFWGWVVDRTGEAPMVVSRKRPGEALAAVLLALRIRS